jgi:hypothetical protein
MKGGAPGIMESQLVNFFTASCPHVSPCFVPMFPKPLPTLLESPPVRPGEREL